MLQFLSSGAHGQAMKQLGRLGSFSQNIGYLSDEIIPPTWDQAIQLVTTQGRVHFDHRRNKNDSKGKVTNHKNHGGGGFSALTSTNTVLLAAVLVLGILLASS
jgi:hypothetical protein